MNEITKKDLLFVYDRNVYDKLKGANIPYLCSGLANKTYKKFWVFARSERVESILKNK